MLPTGVCYFCLSLQVSILFPVDLSSTTLDRCFEILFFKSSPQSSVSDNESHASE